MKIKDTGRIKPLIIHGKSEMRSDNYINKKISAMIMKAWVKALKHLLLSVLCFDFIHIYTVYDS